MTDTDEDKDTRMYTRAEQVANLRTWARELVSGEYRQGRGYLIQKDRYTGVMRYCCIGVAATLFNADLLEKTGVHISWISNYGDSEQSSTVVPEVMQACGLDKSDLQWLAWMNDTEHASFQKIADTLNAWADGLEWVAALEAGQ